MDFPVEILVSEHNLKQVLDSKKQGMGCVLPHKDFGQELCGKALHVECPRSDVPVWYTGPDGGSDPFALELTEEPIQTQHIHNPIWNRLTNGTGMAGQYNQLPNQYAPLLIEYPELSDRNI